jgi:hypothetical protein
MESKARTGVARREAGIESIAGAGVTSSEGTAVVTSGDESAGVVSSYRCVRFG